MEQRLDSLPRMGHPSAIEKILETHALHQIPARFMEYVLAHIEAGHEFSSLSEINRTIGGVGVAVFKLGQLRRAINKIDHKLSNGLSAKAAEDYRLLKKGFERLIVKLPMLPEQ